MPADLSPSYPTRRTLRLDVEVTIDEYDAEYDARDLAEDVREGIFAVLAENVSRDVVLMTVTAADAPPPEPEPGPAHEFTGTVKRADGVIVTASLTVPETHKMAARGPSRAWQGPESPNQNFLELGELAMMIAQQGYGIIERNERSRERWGQQDYWADLLDIHPPTPAIESSKEN